MVGCAQTISKMGTTEITIMKHNPITFIISEEANGQEELSRNLYLSGTSRTVSPQQIEVMQFDYGC